MLTDYHVHIENIDYTPESLNKFIKKAQDEGIEEMGISEHNYRFKETSNIYTTEYFKERQGPSIKEYFELLSDAKLNGRRLKRSTEVDFLPGLESKLEKFINDYDFDYVIGSVHWLEDWGFDVPYMKDIWDKVDLKETYMQYFFSIYKMIDSQLFDIVGHFDVIKVFGYEPEIFDAELISAVEKIVQKIKDNDMCVEINTAGLRKPVGKIYPKKKWLELFYKADIPIVISSDAHYPEHVGADFDKAISLAKEVGYDKVAVFENKKYKLVPLG